MERDWFVTSEYSGGRRRGGGEIETGNRDGGKNGERLVCYVRVLRRGRRRNRDGGKNGERLVCYVRVLRRGRRGGGEIETGVRMERDWFVTSEYSGGGEEEEEIETGVRMERDWFVMSEYSGGGEEEEKK